MNEELHGSELLKAAIDKLMVLYTGRDVEFKVIAYLFERYSAEKAWEERRAKDE